MFNEFLRLGLVLALVFFMNVGSAVRVRTVLLSFLFRLIVEMGRGDESNGLFKRVCWVFPDEEVYESGYATE